MTYSTLVDRSSSTHDSIPVTMPRILIVEDNPDLAYGLRTGLEIEGYEVQLAENGETGLERARAWHPDLVMLDLMLPGMDGYRVLKTLRDGGSDVPVLILTARGEEADKVLGFRLGADDYVTKPCGVLELLARVGALLRRSRMAEHRTSGGDPMERFDIGVTSRHSGQHNRLCSGLRISFDTVERFIHRQLCQSKRARDDNGRRISARGYGGLQLVDLLLQGN